MNFNKSIVVVDYYIDIFIIYKIPVRYSVSGVVVNVTERINFKWSIHINLFLFAI